MLQFTDQLMNIAFRAFIYKRPQPLERPARLLMRLAYPYNAIGKYYMGVYLTRVGLHVEALKLLEEAGLEAPQAFQARAIACIGAMARDEGQIESARVLYEESIRASIWRTGCDDFTRLSVRQCLGILCAIEGESRLALSRFLDLLPETTAKAKQWPVLYLNLLNGVAMELLQANKLDEAARVLRVVTSAPFRWECWLDTAAQICAKMEWSGLKAPEILRFPDGKRLSPSELNLDGKTSATNRHALPFERRRNGWPESLIKGCTLRGKLEAISYLLASNLSDEENDKLLDLLTTLWFETGTWF